MNFLEAVKSGKRFRRKGEEKYLNGDLHGDANVILLFCDFVSVALNIELLLAEDYELEEEKIKLSWSEIENAIDKYYNHIFEHYHVSVSDARPKNSVKEQLGFKENDV